MRKAVIILGEHKYLTWAARIALLLATIVSAFTMPLAVSFLLGSAWAVLLVVPSKKVEDAADKKLSSPVPPVTPDKKVAAQLAKHAAQEQPKL